MKVFSSSTEKLISRILRTIMYGLKSIGLAPVSLHLKKETRSSREICRRIFLSSKTCLHYNLVFSILVQIMGAVVISNISSLIFHSKKFSVSQTVDAARYLFFISTTWFIIIYWGFRQEKAATIMNRLLDVHYLLFDPHELQLQLFNKQTLIFLVVHIAFNVFLWIAAFVSAAMYLDSYLIAFLTNAPTFIIYWFLIEYSIVLGVVSKGLEILNYNLLNLRKFPKSLFRTSNEHLEIVSSPTYSQLAAVKLLHSVRTMLFEVSQLVAEFFSLPILPAIACLAFLLVYNFYFLIAPIVTPISDVSITSTIITATLWILISVYPLTLLSANVTKTARKAKLTGQLVHKLLATATKQEIRTELQQFSLQLMHENVNFTAYGFFPLDFTLLQSIFGVSATYLIIIIQFNGVPS